jgi:hypothetical protein
MKYYTEGTWRNKCLNIPLLADAEVKTAESQYELQISAHNLNILICEYGITEAHSASYPMGTRGSFPGC